MVAVVRGLYAEVGGKQILNGVDLDVNADCQGKVFCIVGEIGAGKSTLATFLALSTSQKTKQRISGISFTCQVNSKSSDIGFLPPTDALLSCLTVFEFLFYRSLQTDPLNKRTMDYHRLRVYQVIDELNITHLTSQLIGHGMEDRGGISGGEKRRVSIASELLFEPSFMVMDEPTTGLDAKTSLQLMKTLKQIAESRNIVVICSIHHVSPVLINQGYIDEVIGMKDGSIINRFSNLKSVIVDHDGELDWMYRPDSKIANLRTEYDSWIPQQIFKRPIRYWYFAKRHAVMRWRMTNTWWVWGSRAALIVLMSICFWDVFSFDDTRNFFDHKGILFVLLMHFQYEALYMAQANMDEERTCYSYEMTRGTINPLTLSLGRIPGEFVMNVLNIVPVTVVLMTSGHGFTMYPTNLGLLCGYYIMFTLVLSSMWKSVGMWLRDYRRMTWIGDLYVNITMQVSGFWVAISALKPAGAWMKYLSTISNTFNLLTRSLQDLTYKETGPGGEVTLISGSDMLVSEGLNMHIGTNLAILLGLFILFEATSIAGAMYGRAYEFRRNTR